MNIHGILTTPWRGTPKSLRWLSLAVLGLCIVGAGGTTLLPDAHSGWLLMATIYCIGLGCFWAFMMASLLVLAIDARQLRLPSISGTVVWSLLCYGVLMVLLPALLLQALGDIGILAGLMMALAIAFGLAFVLLPRYLSSFIGFVPAILIGLHHAAGLHVPLPGQPHFVRWGIVSLVILLLVDVMRWRSLLLDESPRECGYASAMVMQFRRGAAMAHWSGLAQKSSTPMLRRRPEWMLARADLRRVGPQSTVNTLRVALGGWYMPQRWASYLRQMLPVLLPIVLFVPAMGLMQLGDPHSRGLQTLWKVMGVAVVGWVGTFGGLMLAATASLAPSQRWKQVNGELSLLALLPGLGNAASVRTDLLRAALIKPLLAQAVLLALVIGAALTMHVSGIALVLLALVQLGCAGAVVAMALSTFGGLPLSTWPLLILLTGGVVLLSISSFIPLLAQPWPLNGALDALLALAWAAFSAALLLLARRGWRALQQRPHPFLANDW